MKKLLLKNGKLIITRLIKKYDKMIIQIMPAGPDGGVRDSGTKEGSITRK